MKNLLSIFFPVFSSLMLSAQVVIHQDDMPQAGDTIRLSTTVDIGAINYEMAGEGITWDFSSLIPFSQRVDTFVSVSQTPWIYQLLFLTSANLAQPRQEFDQFPGFQVTDVFNFYKNSSNDYRQVGYGVTLNGIPIPTKFEIPDIFYQFPLLYGNSDSSTSSYEFDIPGIGYSGGWKKRVNEADGWGTLVTPYGTFETLRLKTEIAQYDSLYIDSLGVGFPVLRQYTEFKWMGENFGLPLCKVTKEGPLVTIAYIDSARNLITQSQEIHLRSDVLLIPNPAGEQITVRLDKVNPKGIGAAYLVDPTGQRTTLEDIKWTGDRRKIIIPLKKYGLQSGLYLLVIRMDDRIIREKIVIR